MNKLGCHIRFSKVGKYLPGAVETAISFGCNTMMIFMGSPHTTKRVEHTLYNKEAYFNSDLVRKLHPEDIIAHGPYILNPANPQLINFNVCFLVDESRRLEYVGGKFFVLHPGSNQDKLTGIRSVVNVIKETLKKSKKVFFAIETMSGKGNEIGSTFKELKEILNAVNSDRVGVCLDTCHVWDAGYNVRNWNLLLREFDKEIGLNKLFLIHLNDSKNPRGANRDRHANIGQGFIGLDACRAVVNCSLINKVPKILETPWVDGKPIYKEEIQLLTKKIILS